MQTDNIFNQILACFYQKEDYKIQWKQNEIKRRIFPIKYLHVSFKWTLFSR